MKKIFLPGLLVLYCIIAGWGWFLDPGRSVVLLYAWLTSYIVLAFAVAYSSFFSRKTFDYFPFIVLSIILLNFFVQITGGTHSPLWPAYFVFAAVIAVFTPLWRTVASAGIILGIETANRLSSGPLESDRWPIYAGFALSLLIVPALISHIIHRTLREAEQAKDKHDRLIEHADAIDPLSDTDTIEALTETNQLATNVKAALGREDAFAGVIDMIYGFVPAHTYALFLKERTNDSDAYVLRARRSDTDRPFLAPIGEVLRPEHDHGIISGCTKHTQPQLLSEMEPPAGTLGYYTRTMPIKSILAIPIVHQGDNMGVLVVDSLEGGAFSLETVDLLARFAPFFIQIIDKVRVSQELNIRATTFAAMHEMGAVLNSTLELKDMLDRLSREIGIIVPYDFCVVVRFDERTRALSIVHHSGPVTLTRPGQSILDKISATFMPSGKQPAPEDDGPFPLEQGTLLNQMVTQWEKEQSAPYHFPDLGERTVVGILDTTSGLSQQLRTLSCWPLVTREKFIGAFLIGSLHSNAFTEYHRYFIDTLMHQVALVMDNAILHQQISNLARTDGLTGLLNHRTFMEKLAEEHKRVDREPRPFSILLMDIDKFKNVNDKYGHPVGDVAIKAVAKVLKDAARGSDFVARYGGEEFTVGMVDTDVRGAQQMAERIRSILEKTLVTQVFDGELRVTVSIGVSSFPEDTNNWADLVTLADNALYQAKRSGRNRVCLHKDARDAEPAPAKPEKTPASA